MASAKVHSDLEVGLDSGKISGRSFSSDMVRRTCDDKSGRHHEAM
jgi:hypothetical protein